MDDVWQIARFYETNDKSVVVYTTRVKNEDNKTYLEWALQQFSGAFQHK
jgi:hypothetical protein